VWEETDAGYGTRVAAVRGETFYRLSTSL